MLAQRSREEERMDAPDLPPQIYASVLRDLGRVNTVTLAGRPTLRFLDRAFKRSAGPIRLLDVGFGGGDMLRRLARRAHHHGRDIELVGIDLNASSAPVAQSLTSVDYAIEYRTGDYADLADERWDLIVSSLVAHHMTTDQLVAFLRFMERHARLGWFVNDLHRHGVAYMGYPLLARVARWHEIVRQDGRLSIARSYRPSEWATLLDLAGTTHARVFRTFPFRLCVERLR
jgi:2-polyprenyl-3-methyl-5-hydroxy-6-metoxy-1,4-benzoquinol methylase